MKTTVVWPPFIKKFIDFVGVNLQKYSDIAPIIISGSPRTGTTLLMEILATLSKSKTIYEPLHLRRFPGLYDLDTPLPRIYLNPKKHNQMLYEHLEKVFEGSAISKIPNYPLRSLKSRLDFSEVIVKLINGNRLLPWISKNFNLKATYLIIRHPCATISSQLATGWIGYPREIQLRVMNGDINLLRKIILNETFIMPIAQERPQIITRIEKMNTLEELLSVEWSLDYLTSLSYLPNSGWELVVYEELLQNGREIIQNIFKKLEREIPKKAYELLSIPSSTSKETEINVRRQLSKWKKRLLKNQINRILKVADLFELDFYDEKPEPDYIALKNFSFSYINC